MINGLMTMGNIICLVGTILQTKEVMHNKNTLKGYSPIGSLLTLLSVCVFQIGFYLMNNLLSVLFAVPTILFWLVAFIYSIKSKVCSR